MSWSKLFAIPLVALMVSCSSDEPTYPINENIDADMLKQLESAKMSKHYKIHQFMAYERYLPNEEWKDVTYDLLGGPSGKLPGHIIIHEGENWIRLSLFNTTFGPHPLSFFMGCL